MEIRKYIYQKLKDIDVEPSELSAETNFIIENFLKVPNTYVDFSITQAQKAVLDNILEKRDERKNFVIDKNLFEEKIQKIFK